MDIMQEASSVLEQLVGDIRGKFAHSQHQQGVFDSLKAFTAAVDWKVVLLTCSTWSVFGKNAKLLVPMELMPYAGALVVRSLESTDSSFCLCPGLPPQHLLFDKHLCAGK